MARGFGSRGRVVRSDAFLRSAMGDWGPTVYGLALARTCSPTDAQDVYQDVFVRLATDGTEFSDGEHLKAWLVRVTLNRCLAPARSPWRRRTVPLDEAAEAVDPVMNLTVQGEGVASLVYRIAETPTLEDGTAASWFFEGRRTVLGPASASPDAASGESADVGDGCVVYVPVPEEGLRVVRRLDEFEADAERYAAGNDGVSPRGYPYLLCTCVPQDVLRGSGDEILTLLVEYQQALQTYSSWCDEHGETMSDYAPLDVEGSELRSAYRQATWDAAAAIGEVRSSSSEGFVSWMKSCYGIVMGLAADVPEQTKLVVEAIFEDGAVAERAYRIVRADGFDRFDALFEYNGCTVVEGVCSTVRANVRDSPSKGPRSGTLWLENPIRTSEASVWSARFSPSSTPPMSGRIAGRRALPRMAIAAQRQIAAVRRVSRRSAACPTVRAGPVRGERHPCAGCPIERPGASAPTPSGGRPPRSSGPTAPAVSRSSRAPA